MSAGSCSLKVQEIPSELEQGTCDQVVAKWRGFISPALNIQCASQPPLSLFFLLTVVKNRAFVQCSQAEKVKHILAMLKVWHHLHAFLVLHLLRGKKSKQTW